MRRIRNSAFGVGIATGVALYAFVRFYQQLAQPGLALDLLAALGVGLGLSLCYYLLCRLALRRLADRFRALVAPTIGTSLPLAQADALDDVWQTHERAVKALTRHDRYSAITDQLLSSDDIGASLRVIAEHAAKNLPIDGAALFVREGAVLRAAATWNLEAPPLPETEQDSPVWRSLHENRPLLLNHAGELGPEAGLRSAALLVLPLDIADRPIGVLALANRTAPAAFQDDDLATARFFAGQAALAVRQAHSSAVARAARNQIAALCQVARELGDPQDLDAVLQRALAAAAALTASSHATMLLLDEGAERITRRIALDSQNMAPLRMVAEPMMSRGLAGWVARERRAALIRDTEQDARWLPGPGLGDMRSALAAPLLYDNRPLGIITLAHDALDHYGEDHLQLLEVLGAQAALAIENARLAGAGRLRAAEHERACQAGVPAADAAPASQARAEEVVAVCVDMRGYAGVSKRLAPELIVNDILDVYLRTMAETIERHGGYIDKCSGDGILALFGHPERRPDDALRAAQAALAIRRAAARLRASWRARLGVDLNVAVGVGGGRVVVGRGASGCHDAMVLGEAVDLASQLQALARPGEILAAAPVIEALDQRAADFVVEALPPLPVDGPDGLRHIYRLGDPIAPARAASPHNRLAERQAAWGETVS